MSRTTYDLGHYLNICGQIGRIQTLTVIPVVGGDSLEIDIDGPLRLAATRKEIVSECQVDICAFYVKHRHVLGSAASSWAQYVRRGVQNPSNPYNGIAVAAAYRDPFYLGIKTCSATVNPALVRGYNFIMQRYFLVPNTPNNGEYSPFSGGSAFDPSSFNFYPTNESWAANMRQYGAMSARLPHVLNAFNVQNNTTAGGFPSDLTTADYQLLLSDASPNVAALDIRDLEGIKGRYKTVQEANYFASFYDDIMQKRYGTSVNTDADPRPDYLGRSTSMLSGHDVDGTDDATLGTFVGKTAGRASFNMRRRLFKEHGNVWVMAVLRYPLIHTKEQHPLLATAVPDTNLLLGDPEVWSAQKPVAFDPAQWLSGGSVYTPNVANAAQPYGQEYRYQTNRTHQNYEIIPGYPFSNWDTTSAVTWNYYFDNEYAKTFQTSQLAHWQMTAKCKATRYSRLPAPTDSIFAGT